MSWGAGMHLVAMAAVVAVSEAGVGVPGVIWNASKFAVKNTTNVVYGQGLRCNGANYSPTTNCTAMNLLLDVYEPVDAGPTLDPPTLRPAYILSHGGGNSGGSKEQYCFQGSAAFFTSRGFVAFNIDYRLAGEHGLLPPGPGPDPGPAPPSPTPPATAGDPIVAAAQTTVVKDWWPHPNTAGTGGPKTTPLRFGGPAGTLCITLKPAPGPPYCSCCPTTCCASPARPGKAACQCCRGEPPPVTHGLALEPCATAESVGPAAASQLWTVQSWGIRPQAVVHNATGLCLSVPSSTTSDSPRPVEAAPCQRASPGQVWQLGFSGRLFTTVPASLGSVNSVELSAVPAATFAASLNAAATNADDDGYQEEAAARGHAEDSDRPALMGWTPKWQSGYPAVRDLKAAIRWVRANAAKYNVDPSRVVVSGGSAGATNSVAAGVTFDGDYRDELTVAEDPTLATTNLDQNDSVQCVVAHWSSDGEIDLVTEYDPKHASRFTTKNAPIVEFHGSVDTTIPISHALRVQAEYNKTGVRYELHVLESCAHGAWCYDGNGTCSCENGVAGYGSLMDKMALPFVAKVLDLALG